MGLFRKKRSEAPRPSADTYLDRPLLRLTSTDVWTIRDACEGTQIFGAPGSGKTSGSGAAIAKSFLRAGFGGLVLCAKPEERQLWERYAQETGRENHLIFISSTDRWRFNFLDYELKQAGRGEGLTENLVNLFSHITEVVEGKQDSNGKDAFWQRAMNEMLRNAIDLLSLTCDTLTLEDICLLILEAPQSRTEARESEWQQTSFCAECLHRGNQLEKTAREEHDFDVSARYWLDDFPTLSAPTRTSIVKTFTSIADMLQHGILWELFSTTTNIVPEVTYKQGAIIVLDIPILQYIDVGRMAQGIFKYLFQRAMLRRNVDVDPRPVFLWADESQHFVSSYDFQFQSVARSFRVCTAYLTQNISNYYAVLGAKARDDANSLLGNFQTKIFHANTDVPTNQFAADTIGQDWTTTFNFNSSRTDQGTTNSGGGGEVMQYMMQPSEFTRLQKGGRANGNVVEGIMLSGGRVWNATGKTYLKVKFKQG